MRKAAHGSIVAPLAAALAASVALGVGVSLARAERERRAARAARSRDRRFALLAGERLGVGLRRIALGQLDVAIDSLERRDAGASPEKCVHEARKALKRLRALLRLVQDELGEQSYAHEAEVLRRAGRGLARARDAEVLLSTLEGLLERHPKKLGRRRGVQRLRASLRRERDGVARLALAHSAAPGGAVDELRALRARVAIWQLTDPGGFQAIEAALERLYGKGRRRMRRAKKAGGEQRRARTLHEWRKRVKDLRYAAEMLDREDDRGERRRGRSKPGGRRRKRSSGRAAFLAKVARRADDLGELLGEEHDLAVLAERVRGEPAATRSPGAPGARSRKALLSSIARRRRRLRKRALRDGAELYRRTPAKFVRRARSAAALGSLGRR